MSLGTPWGPADVITPNPSPIQNRTIGPSIGNRYGGAELVPVLPPFTPGIMSPAAKAEMTAAIDTLLGIWPWDYSVDAQGTVRLVSRAEREGIRPDPRAGAPALDAIAAQAGPREASFDQRYGGQPSWWIDWDYGDQRMAEKMYQLLHNLKVAIAAI